MGKSTSKANHMRVMLEEFAEAKHLRDACQQTTYKSSIKFFSAGFALALFLFPAFLHLYRMLKREAHGPTPQLTQCPRCKQQLTDVIVLPCRHFSHCFECELKDSPDQHDCSVCGQHYAAIVKVHL